jgi:hypothetical protein
MTAHPAVTDLPSDLYDPRMSEHAIPLAAGDVIASIAARHGIFLPAYVARQIVAALLGWSDQIAFTTLDIPTQCSPDERDAAVRQARRRLVAKVMEDGRLPVGLPMVSPVALHPDSPPRDVDQIQITVRTRPVPTAGVEPALSPT